jgi:ABC-2 type transport system ATP-binding protein
VTKSRDTGDGPIIHLQGLRQSYGDYEALRGLTATVRGGTIGLLGPNGAGKSTLLKVLLGLVPHDEGAVELMGLRLPDDVFEIRRRIGYMPETEAVHPSMTAIAYVTFAGVLCGMPRGHAFQRAHDILYHVGLGEARYRKLKGFSQGMRQRAKLAQALVHGPRLLFLDEPTSGLDPQGREDMLGLVHDVAERGIHVVVSTHILNDVERTCDHVFLMNAGSIIFNGPMDKLRRSETNTYLVDVKRDVEGFRRRLERAGCKTGFLGFKLSVQVPEAEDGDLILRTAVDGGYQIRHFTLARQTLEMAFMELVEKARGTAAEEVRSA